MSSMLHQFINTNDLMKSAINAFEEWRTTRNRREPIPDHLWLLVEPLTKHYSLSQITKNLHLNTAQIKTQLSKLSSSEKNVPELVECTQQFSMLSASNNKTSECSIEFDCKHASSVKLSGLNINELKQMVSLLISEAPCYN
jgi:hypothetical protein